ncbi:aldose 1-epimerase family protein [Microbacterium sp. cx-55]|uniref:aldose 1-epimerase family protein n=1 Tax=Microbacterium sp. cx-55 TaxID=2875948 RepID=UPI001CBFFC70|nr:aldose 1-epimerase family protein [Microbacterium sp. cx-55]MBZ4487666.1 aldose 1-epimerase family protein [Microbacterium sp. cx-55]UGB35678.1 aldose 1-epimerase family protein [Microbacterium sp. cx-55]
MGGIPLSGTPHVLRSGAYEASISSVGATLRTLTFDGRHLVVPFAADEVRPAYRGATLAPWPNRVVDGRYEFAGTEYELALTEPGRGHALHGLAAWLDFEAIDKGPDHVTVSAVVEAQSGYPWRIRIETRFSLDADGLTQTVRATNESDAAAPYGTGPHPYLVAGAGTVDDWTLELPAADVLHVTPDRLIPTELRAVDADDPARFDYRIPRTIGDAEIDHAYTGLRRDGDGIATVRVTDADGSGVAMTWDAACGWVQVHTADLPTRGPGHRGGLAVEPMTCAPDAFHASAYPFDTGLLVVGPGESVDAGWRIAAI